MRTFDEIARASPEYVEALYQQFRRDPASVDERWALLFKGYEFGQESGPSDGSGGTGGQAVADLVHGYRELGYLVADVDPLARGRRSHSLLDLRQFGFRDTDLDREMDCRAFRGLETGPTPRAAGRARALLLRHPRRRVPVSLRQGAARMAPGAHRAPRGPGVPDRR